MYKVTVTDYTFPDLSVEEAILKPAGARVEGAQSRTAEAVIACMSSKFTGAAVCTSMPPTVFGVMAPGPPPSLAQPRWLSVMSTIAIVTPVTAQ